MADLSPGEAVLSAPGEVDATTSAGLPWWDPATWQAIGVWVALVVTGALVMWQVLESRRTRHEKARPNVVAYLANHGGGFVDLVLRNFGPSAALDVRLTISPTPRRAVDTRGGVENVWLPDAIPTLAPGQEWRTYWDAGYLRFSSEELSDEDRHEAAVTWRSRIPGAKHGRSTSTLDWGAHKGVRNVEQLGMHDAAAALREIARTVEKWSEKPPSDAGGLSVYVRDGGEKDRRFAQRYDEWLARRRRPREEGQAPGVTE